MNLNDTVKEVDDVLQSRGFQKSGLTWNRVTSGLVEVIDLQLSKSKTEITVNCGIQERRAYLLVWGKEPERFVQEPFCVVRARIGELGDGQDVWWSIADEGTARNVAVAVTRTVLPFLETFESLETIERFLQSQVGQPYPLPNLYLASIKYLRGDSVGACRVLEVKRKKALGDWKKRFDEVSERLGCGIA